MATQTDLPSRDDGGKLLLRLVLGGMLLFHGVAKLTHGIAGIEKMVTGLGMPSVLAYGVFVGEVVAPILLIVGLWTRLAALLVVVNMVVAVLLAHPQQFFTLSQTGGWALELQGFFFFTAVAIALLGAGRYSMGGTAGRWN